MEKQEFQIGETAYLLDCDMSFFEEKIQTISLRFDGKTIEYETVEGLEFTKDDIGKTVFKSAESRESFLVQYVC